MLKVLDKFSKICYNKCGSIGLPFLDPPDQMWFGKASVNKCIEERGMLMKKETTYGVVNFIKTVLSALKLSVTFKMPFINVTLATSYFQAPIGAFSYLPPAFPNSAAL